MVPLELRIKKDNDRFVIQLKGDLDGSGANQVVHALHRLRGDSRGNRVILDLSTIEKLEYFGVATLSRFIRNHQGQFREIKLEGLQALGANAFRRFGLESCLST